MNTFLSALLLRENESVWGGGTFRRYKQLTERSQRLNRQNQNSRGKSQSTTRKTRRGRDKQSEEEQQDPAQTQTSGWKQKKESEPR